ncbi:MAG: protein kinase [Planctomycetota bacterium]
MPQLVEKLGGGGMGVVYRAVQTSLGRSVALKLVRPELLYFDGARDRFRREVEAAARLRHPDIVPIYSVGEEQGIPYFAMELIEGQSLGQVLRCLEGRNPNEVRPEDLNRIIGSEAFGAGSWIETCLRIARRVAGALAHAHLAGIAHRDVKPSNIMLDKDGRVLLVDFGLARADDAGKLTLTGAAVGSPLYLPPEKLRGDPGLSAPRQDVYSLGVTLYETLGLCHPFSGASLEDTHRRVVEADPVRLRTRVRGLPWDVETVCQTAMDPDPRRRYPSAVELERDLDNLLHFRRIEAERPGLFLRGRRWVQRHPTSSVGLVLGFLLLVVAPTIAGISIHAERDRAVSQAKTARRVVRLLVESFGMADPSSTGGRDLTAKEVLELGTSGLEIELQDEPEVLGSLLDALARVYRRLGYLDRANELVARALAIRTELFGEGSLEVAQSLSTEAGIALAQRRPRSEVEKALQRSLAIREQRLGKDHALVGVCLAQLARLEYINFSAAGDAYLERAKAILDSATSEHRTVLIEVLLARSSFYLTAGREQQAAQCLRETMRKASELLPAGHPLSLRVRRESAWQKYRTGELLNGEGVFWSLLEATRSLYKYDWHPAVVEAESELSLYYWRTGEIQKAAIHQRRVLEQSRKFLASDSVHLMNRIFSLAKLLVETGEFEKAEQLHLEAIQIGRKLWAREPYSRTLPVGFAEADGLHNLGRLYHRRNGPGDYQRAEAHYRRAIEAKRLLNATWATGWISCHLADLYREHGHLVEAVDLYRSALEKMYVTGGRYQQDLEYCFDRLLQALRESGREAEIGTTSAWFRGLLEKAVAEARGHADWGFVAFQKEALIGRLHAEEGNFEEAERLLLPALQQLEKARGPRHAFTVKVRGYVRGLYERWGRAEEAGRYTESHGTK